MPEESMLRRFKQCLNKPEEVRKTEYSNSPHVEKGKFIIRTIFKETRKGAGEMVGSADTGRARGALTHAGQLKNKITDASEWQILVSAQLLPRAKDVSSSTSNEMPPYGKNLKHYFHYD